MRAMNWGRIYDLRSDTSRVAQMQDASQNKPGLGLSAKPALVGSEEWWSMVDDGRLAQHELVGTIAQVYWGGTDDQPAFQLTTANGDSSRWFTEGDPRRYLQGLKARLRYVLQPWKQPNRYGFEGSQRLVLSVDLEVRLLRAG